MAVLLNRSNIKLIDYRENEVGLAINVMEEHLYCMSPALALELAEMLETNAREVIEIQARAPHRLANLRASCRTPAARSLD